MMPLTLVGAPAAGASFAGFCAQARRMRVHHIGIDDGSFDLACVDSADVEDTYAELIRQGLQGVLLRSAHPLAERDAWREVCRRASRLGIRCLQIVPPAGLPDPVELAGLLRQADRFALTVLVEDGADGSAASPPEVLDSWFRACRVACPEAAPSLVFNPPAYLKAGLLPLHGMFMKSRQKNHFLALRVADAAAVTLEPRLPGQGNAQVKELISIMLARRAAGFFLVEAADGPPSTDGSSPVEAQIEAFRTLRLTL